MDKPKVQRTCKACQGCREKRIRCELGEFDNPKPPCKACLRSSSECVFQKGRRRKTFSKYLSTQGAALPTEEKDEVASNPHEGAYTLHRQASARRYQSPYTSISEHNSPNASHDIQRDFDSIQVGAEERFEDGAETSLARAEIHTGLDALDVLANSRTLSQDMEKSICSSSPGYIPSKRANAEGTPHGHPSNHPYSSGVGQPEPETNLSWQQFKLIRRGIINQSDTRFLLDL